MDTTPILGYDYATIDQIVRFTDGNDLPPVCLLALGLQESNLNIYENTGDAGQSFGVFQIHVPAHGGDESTWTGYDGLARSMTEMVGRWQMMFERHGSWEAVVNDIVNFQQAWSPDAQGSIAWTHDMAHRQISKAMAIYLLYLKRQQVVEAPADTTRRLLDAITVSRDVWADHARDLERMHAAAVIRSENDAALVEELR